MRHLLEEMAGQYSMYHARRDEFTTDSPIPFRVSPEPFELVPGEREEILRIGSDVAQFIDAANELYHTDEQVHATLNTGKPEVFCVDRPTQYLFIRPDLIITEHGFTICEVETSPFGLGLSHLLTQGYAQEGFEVMVGPDALPAHVQDHAPMEGTIVYSDKTAQYSGQLTFLADTVFGGEGRHWTAEHTADVVTDGTPETDEYRGFYLAEYLKDPSVRALVDRNLHNPATSLFPSLTPHLEEKAILALLWDKRLDRYLKSQLGTSTVRHLRDVVPPTWIVGQEEHFLLGLPDGIARSSDLANLSASKRTMVLKSSGFSTNSSWAEGVTFLEKQSREKARTVLQQAEQDRDVLYVVQQFRKGVKRPIRYEVNGHTEDMYGRVRITPYFSMPDGKLLSVKATIRENSDLIHGSSDSVSTAVM